MLQWGGENKETLHQSFLALPFGNPFDVTRGSERPPVLPGTEGKCCGLCVPRAPKGFVMLAETHAEVAGGKRGWDQSQNYFRRELFSAMVC